MRVPGHRRHPQLGLCNHQAGQPDRSHRASTHTCIRTRQLGDEEPYLLIRRGDDALLPVCEHAHDDKHDRIPPLCNDAWC